MKRSMPSRQARALRLAYAPVLESLEGRRLFVNHYLNAPFDLSAVPASSGGVNLAWAGPAGGESRFRIERSADGSTWSQVTTVAAGVTTFTDKSVALAEATTYHYRVAATSAAGDSAYGPVATSSTLPKAPSALAVTDVGGGQVRLDWADNSSVESGYAVEQSANGKVWTQIGTAASNATSYGPFTGSTGTFYRVRSLTAAGVHSAYSSTPATPYANAIGGLKVTAASASRINVAWTDNGGGSGFRVERSADNKATWQTVGTVGAGVTTLSDAGLSSEGYRYFYRVTATGGTGGDSPFGNSLGTYTRPAAPGSLSATYVSSSRIDVAWSDHSAVEDTFRVEMLQGGSWVQVGSVGANVTSYSAGGTFSPSGTYLFRVRAADGPAGYSLYTGVNAYPHPGPIPAIAGPSEVAEGGPYLLSLAANGPGADAITSWTIDWGDGSAPQTVAGASSVASHRFADDGIYAVEAWAHVGSTTYAASPRSVTVQNAAPLPSGALPPLTAEEGVALRATLARFTDPGFGAAETFSATIDWGDGSATGPGTLSVTAGAAGRETAIGVSGEHAYAAAGTYTVTVTVTDDDWGTRTVTNEVEVAAPPAPFLVPGLAGEVTTLTFAITNLPRAALYGNELGFFFADDDGHGLGTLSPGDAGYAAAGLTDASQRVVFSRYARAGDVISVDVPAGKRLHFYIVQDATTEDWVDQTFPPDYAAHEAIAPHGLDDPTRPNAFFVSTPANFDGYGHFRVSDQPGGGTLYHVEDLTGGGDQDFNDVVFLVEATSTNARPTVDVPAAVGSTPVAGTATTVSALGADDGGEANLTYTWSLASGPAPVTFSANGSNAAKGATATFASAGVYELLVTISDGVTEPVTSSVTFTVAQTLTAVVVSPSTADVPAGTTRSFAAVALDQFDVPLATQPTFSWSVSGGGTVSSSGLFTAGSSASGPFTLTATAGAVGGTAELEVTAAGGPVVGTIGASASPVTGTSATLSVSATSGDSSALSYSWEVVGTPPASVSFANATSSSTAVTFAKAGSYAFKVTVTNASGTATATLPLTVVQTAATIAVTPSTANVGLGKVQQFAAVAKDQFGDALAAQPTFAWTVDGGSANGTINAGGLYAAPASGTSATVRAAGLSISGTAAVALQGSTSNQVPVVTSISAPSGPVAGATATLTAAATDDGPAADLTYSWALVSGPSQAPEPAYSATGTNAARTTTVTFRAAGTYTFRVAASDGRRSGTRDVTVTVAATPTAVRISPGVAGITNGTTRAFSGTVVDQFGDAIVGESVAWALAPGGAGSINASTGVYAAPGSGSGGGAATVVATHGSLSATAAVTTGNAANAAPALMVTSVAGTGGNVVPKVAGEAEIFGYVDDPDDDLASWSLSLRPVGGGADILLNSGTGFAAEQGAVGTGVKLGTIRPTLLKRGVYKIILTATDAANRTSTTAVREFEVTSELRLGNLTLPVTNLTVGAPGMPLAVSRVYDSSRANENRGDFGWGWRWEQVDLDLQTSARPRAASQVGESSLGSFYAVPPTGLNWLTNPTGTTTDGDVVSFTLPGGERHVFKLQLDVRAEQIASGLGGPLTTVTRLQFVPVNGVQSRLTVETDVEFDTLRIDVTTGQIYSGDDSGSLGEGYHPADPTFGSFYYLTTQQGLTYRIAASSGRVQTVTDLNGNQIDYTGSDGATGAMLVRHRSGGSAGGLGAATGPAIKVKYDGGKIDWVEDPEGNRFDYAYDANGDLVGATDREPDGGSADATVYDYAGTTHLLSQVTDARGVNLVQATYDGGELSSLVNAENKSALLSTAPGPQAGTTVQTSIDLAGNRVESVFDSAGNLVRAIRELQDPLDGDVTRYSVTTREYDASNRLFRESVPFFADAGDRFTKAQSVWATTREYTGGGNVSTETDAMGRKTTYLNHFGFTDPAPTPEGGAGIEFLGKAGAVTDWLNNTTELVYEAQTGNLLVTENAKGERTRFTYNGRGQVLDTYRDDADTNLADDTLVSANTYGGPFGRLDSTTTYNSTAAGDSAARRYVYDGNGNVEVAYYVWTDPQNGTVQRTVVDRSDFNDDDRVTGTRRYDLDGDVSASLTSAGYVAYLDGETPMSTSTATEYDSVGQAVATTDGYDRDTLYDYDPRGNLIRTVYPDGTEVRSVYDDMGRLVWQTDRYHTGATSLAVPNATADAALTARATHTTYDALGRAVEVRRHDGVWVEIEAGTPSALRVSGVPTPPSAGAALSLAQTIYDAAGRVATSIGTDGEETHYTYYVDGQVRTVEDELGNVTTYAPRRPDDAATSYDDKAEDRVTDANGHSTRTAYDELGRVTRVTYHDGSFVDTTYSYTLTGDTVTSYRQRKSTDPQRATVNAYDLGGRLVQVTQPDPDAVGPLAAPVWQYDHDAWGNQTLQRDPLDDDLPGGTQDRETTFAYDAQGRRVGRSLPLGQGESQSYDIFGRLEQSVDFKGNTTVYVYFDSGDDAGRLHFKQYYAPGQSLASTPAQEIEYAYDDLGRALSVAEREAGTLKLTTGFGYDAEGRVVLETLYDHGASAYLKVIRYAFEESTGRHVATWTAAGLVTATDLASARTAARTLTEYGYDELGRLETTTLKRVNGTTVSQVTTNAYDDVGNLDTAAQPNGVVTDYGYDELNRLETVVAKKGSTTLFSQTYVLASDGQRESATEVNDGASSAVTWAYDDLDRLTGETRTGANAYAIGWTLDAAGNRLTETRGGVTKHYRYDANDRLTGVDLNDDGDTADAGEIAYTHDANGSTTQVVTVGGSTIKNLWDVRNRLVSVDGNGDDLTIAGNGGSSGAVDDNDDATYRYTDGGHRIAKTFGTDAMYFVVDGTNPTGYSQVLEESDTPGGTSARTYTVGLDVLAQTAAAGASQFMLVDGMGSVRGLTSAAGVQTAAYGYEAFGTAAGFDANGAASGLLFAGEYYDSEREGYYNRARGYDPSTGRFLSFDSFEADPGSPAALHKYTYANVNPTMLVDPSGLIGIVGLIGNIGVRGVLTTIGTNAAIGGVTNAASGLIFGETGLNQIGYNLAEGAALGIVSGGVGGAVQAGARAFGRAVTQKIGLRLALQGATQFGGILVESALATAATSVKMRYGPPAPGNQQRWPTNGEVRDLLLANIALNLAYKGLGAVVSGPVAGTAADEVAALRRRFNEAGGDPEAWKRRVNQYAGMTTDDLRLRKFLAQSILDITTILQRDSFIVNFVSELAQAFNEDGAEASILND